MVDGTAASALHQESAFCAQLDTAADICFAVCAFCKLLPAFHMPAWLWIWFVCILAIKLTAIAIGFWRTGTLVSAHTGLNKVTGFALYLLPLLSSLPELQSGAIMVCVLASFAAIQELLLLRM